MFFKKSKKSTGKLKKMSKVTTFVLRRFEDESGVSGTGDVAEGVVFTDGTVVMRWLTDKASTAIYNSMEELHAIHSHGHKTGVYYTGEVKTFPEKQAETKPLNILHSKR